MLVIMKAVKIAGNMLTSGCVVRAAQTEKKTTVRKIYPLRYIERKYFKKKFSVSLGSGSLQFPRFALSPPHPDNQHHLLC